jgi:diguanylate cyclase
MVFAVASSMVLGGLLGVALMTLGFGLGVAWARSRDNGRPGWRRPAEPGLALEQPQRDRIMQLLQELGRWTSEYSGSVSQYQDRLSRLSDGVAEDRSAGGQLVALLKQIMHSNGDLQTRLEAAESQLEKQTQQIESYLNEARTDSLTGLCNRRAYDQRLDELFAAYQQGGPSFVLALIDVDHFKSINDDYGHPVGDQVLRRLAAALEDELSDALIVARYGGEEFVALLRGPLQVAATRMNEVRKSIRQLEHRIPGVRLDVTISVGLSESRDDALIGPIVRRADAALYLAKETGRDRVYYHDGRRPTLVGAPEVISGDR